METAGKVSLQNPYTQQTLDEFCLTDNTLSTSGNTEQYTGHIINPLTGIYNEQKKLRVSYQTIRWMQKYSVQSG